MSWRYQTFAAAVLALVIAGTAAADDPDRKSIFDLSVYGEPTQDEQIYAGMIHDQPVHEEVFPSQPIRDELVQGQPIHHELFQGQPLHEEVFPGQPIHEELIHGEPPVDVLYDYGNPVGVPPAEPLPGCPTMTTSFGWWFTDTKGSLTKVGEYEDLEPSPFWNLDGLFTDGYQTLDLTLSGLDLESNQADMFYYRPGLTADVEYQRFPHRRDHDPLDNFRSPPADSTAVTVEDNNVGEDYAIRVQELDANFKGRLTKHLDWRLNVWGMRKSGERQANATAHCYHPGDFSQFQCHVVSQRQRIDWLTMEIEPVIAGQFGPVSAEYSRTMRSFSQDDQLVTRDYDNAIIGFPGPASDVQYAVVPDSFTQIDRVRINASLTSTNRFYAHLFMGDTTNKFRDMRRRFDGFDLRWSDSTIDGLTLTGYAKVFDERTAKVTTLLPDPGGETSLDDIREPIDRQRTKAGVKGRWRPFRRSYSSDGLSLTAGYEYNFIDRENVQYEVDAAPGTFLQPDTKSNLLNAGASMRWSPSWETFARYKMALNDNPLLGVSDDDVVSLASALNTRLPEQSYLVEVGGTWVPTEDFLLNATLWIENGNSASQYAQFDEESLPFTFTAWYAPTPRWSLSAGYARFSSWLDQEITLGDTDPFTSIWNYDAQADVFSAGARFAWNDCLTFTGDLQAVRGRNAFDTPPSPDPGVVDYSDLPGLSDVIVETVRLNLGADYWLRERVVGYLHYTYYDYDDESAIFNSGKAHMILVGLTGIF